MSPVIPIFSPYFPFSTNVLHSITLQISIGCLYVISSVIPLALKGILPIGMIRIGKIPLTAKGITDEITYKHTIDICSAVQSRKLLTVVIDMAIVIGNI